VSITAKFLLAILYIGCSFAFVKIVGAVSVFATNSNMGMITWPIWLIFVALIGVPAGQHYKYHVLRKRDEEVEVDDPQASP
jgi:Na+/melibiose symporter-like transporter